jgi:hypothetical protein
MKSMRSTMILSAAVSGLLYAIPSPAAERVAGSGSGPDFAPSQAQPLGDIADAGAKPASKGQNGCKGQGGCKTDKHACKGQNDCKGQGGCRTDGKK